MKSTCPRWGSKQATHMRDDPMASEINELKLNSDMAQLFFSQEVTTLHKRRLSKDPAVMQRMLAKDVKPDGSVCVDPSKYGLAGEELWAS